jgi:hypothetical protein
MEDNAVAKVEDNAVVAFGSVADMMAAVPKNDANKVAAKKAIAVGGGFLPRLQFFSAKSGACSSGSFPVNHFGLVQGQARTDIGEEVLGLVIDWRPKALDTSGDDVRVSHDPESEVFADITRIFDSRVPNNGCMVGPEFLVWLPESETFATFFWGSMSANIESEKPLAILNDEDQSNWMMFTPIEIPSKKYANWFIQTASATAREGAMPPAEGFRELVSKFQNPSPQDDVDEVPDDTERVR